MSVLALSLLGSCLALQDSRATDRRSARIDRLLALCKLWGTVKYFHPYLAYRDDIDWDKALIDAIPKIDAAQSAAEYADAVQSMLDALRDPTTRVLRHSIVGPPSKGERQPPMPPIFSSVTRLLFDFSASRKMGGLDTGC
jgi:hypothetical protein